MRYYDARDKIHTGDVLGIKGRTTLASFTRLAQRLGGLGDSSAITHCGVAWWVAGRLYCVEMDGAHNVLRPVSQHVRSSRGLEVYRPPPRLTMAAHFDAATYLPIKYSIWELAKIGGRLVFGLRTGQSAADALVCSTFTARWLQWAGWVPPDGFPAMPSPAEQCMALGAAVLVIDSP
jgi:hypothetical protein